ncbi:MAG: DUF2141 domain-containing protein [Burkholderiales bacterium]|nr:DUF2141 domain-containing protein [Burkholderiales bacterium]
MIWIPTISPVRSSLLVWVLASIAPAQAADDDTQSISVKVGTFRNLKGNLGCRLFKSADGFPEGSTNTVEITVKVHAQTEKCEFKGVLAGTYAVSVSHDENENGKLDKNFLGIPTEGYGVSNNHTYAMKSPTWDESKFQVKTGSSCAIEINLRY